MDNSIVLPGGYRIGIDPLLGLLPGIGDVIGAAVSLWIIWDAALLGLPLLVIARMLLNLVVDTAGGSLPVVGDLFDAVWKANALNMRLAEKHYSATAKPRSGAAIFAFFALALLFLMAGSLAASYWVVRFFFSLFGR